jgi:hypothetical protein
LDCANNAGIYSAATDITVHEVDNLAWRGNLIPILISKLISIEQRNRGHDHPRGAVSALQCTFFQKGLLHRMQPSAARQPLNGGDLFVDGSFGWRDARPLGSSIDQDRTGAALALSATVLGPHQIQVLPQYGEQAGLRIHIDRAAAAVYSKLNRSHRDPPTCEPLPTARGRFENDISGMNAFKARTISLLLLSESVQSGRFDVAS